MSSIRNAPKRSLSRRLHSADSPSNLKQSNQLPAVLPSGEGERLAVRLSLNSYLSSFLIGSFFSAFLLYLGYDVWALALFVMFWVVVPFFALSEKIVFEGTRITRTGPAARLRSWIIGSRRRLRISAIEHVETHAMRTIRRGNRVYASYRTVISGRDMQINLVSGTENFRKILRRLLPLLPDEVLDNRSLEMRDYLVDPKEVLMKVAEERLPEADVLENAFEATRGRPPKPTEHEASPQRAEYLRRLGNELRLIGRLHQALESFRRALVLQPNDARLIFDFARCLHAFAGLRSNERLQTRSLAAMRLAERHAMGDADLLTRLGEAYFHFGEWSRAGGVFQKVVDLHGESFLAARGMAEIALREGKLAHVVHNFSAANRLASTSALRRYTNTEAEYFANLNNDEEYMEMEVGRVNLLQSLENGRKTAARVGMLGTIPLGMGLGLTDDLLTNIGWAMMAAAVLFWTLLTAGTRFFASRIPYDIVADDR